MRARWLAVVLMAAIGAGSWCGCNKEPGKPTSGTSGSATPVIGVVPKGLAHIFWQTVHAGAKAAAEEFAVEIIWQGPAKETEYELQRSIVEDLLARPVQGLVLAPAHEETMVPAIEQAYRDKIPVVIFDSDAKTDKRVSFVATDNYQGGVQAAETLAKLLGGKGKVCIVATQPGGASTMKREQGFEDTIKKKYPGITIVDKKYGESDRDRSMSVAEDMLTRHMDLNGMFASNESGAVGAVRALKTQDRIGKVKLVGFDSSPDLIEALKGKRIQALVVQNPFAIGYQAVKAVVDHIAGERVPKRIDTGVKVVTLENLSTPEVQALINPKVDKPPSKTP